MIQNFNSFHFLNIMKNFIKIKNCSDSKEEIRIGIIVFLCIERKILNIESNHRNLLACIRRKKKDRFFEKFARKLEGESVQEIIEKYNLTINFWWAKKTPGMMPRIVHKMSSNSRHQKTINFLIESTKFELEKIRTYNLKLLIGDNPLDVRTNFWDCAAEILGLDKDFMIQKWGRRVISFNQEREFIQKFGKGFTVWRIESFADRERNNAKQRLVFKSSTKNHFVLQSQMSDWDIDKSEITMSDSFTIPPSNLFNYYRCPNCHFNDKDLSNFQRHVKNCSTEQIHKYKWLDLNARFDPQKYLLENKFIDEIFENKFFVCYDIETFMDGVQTEVSSATKIQSAFKIVSIAVTKNFGTVRSIVFVRNDFSEESYIKLASDFLAFLIKSRDEYRALLPKRHNDAFFGIKDILSQKKELRLSVNKQNNLQKAFEWLNKLRELKCWGFNSERFDNPCLVPAILKALFSRYFKSISPNEKPLLLYFKPVKRANGYMSLNFLGLGFGDIANHYTGATLDRMGQSFKTPAQKGIFPYELYNDLKELETSDWPSYSCFKSSLKVGNPKFNVEVQLTKSFDILSEQMDFTVEAFLEKFDVSDFLSSYKLVNGKFICNVRPESRSLFHVDPFKYAESLILFESMKLKKPEFTMLDWLKFYNLQDTEVLCQAFERMISLFHEKIQLNLLDFLSMPSAARRSLWSNMDTSHGHAYTLSDNFGWLAKLFRNALKGGLAVPLHRHAVVGQDACKWPKDVSVKTKVKGLLIYIFMNSFFRLVALLMASLTSQSFAGISLHFIHMVKVEMHRLVLDMFSRENQMENSIFEPWQKPKPNTVRKQ